MESFLFLLLIPVLVALIAKRLFHHTITWPEMGIQIVASILVLSIVWFAGSATQTSDTEIWNGQVISKERVHDHYLDPYDCFCYTSCSGSGDSESCTQHCQTCYEDRYTVDWSAKTTLGNITFDHKDQASKSVYNLPDPAPYAKCVPGEPASKEHQFTNYIKAVPESLFHDNTKPNLEFAGKVPAYPRVHSFYKINRVINVDSSVNLSIINNMNTTLSEYLIGLGHSKQVNVVVILTEIDDPSYRYEVEKLWLGGKKNDVVVIVGVDGNKINWVDVMTWASNSGNELFRVTLRDELLSVGDITNPQIATTIATNISKLYDRPQMKDYEYLKDQVDPPTWVIVLSLILAIGGSTGLTYLFHRNDVV